MSAHKEKEMAQSPGIPVRKLPPGTMLKEIESELKVYERRYEMSSEKMATLMELDAISPTAEVLDWYHSFYEAKLLREATPTTGTPGTTTERSMTSG